MYTDASNVRIGASLHQKQSDGTVRPIAYASRKLLPAERNYCASDKEAVAVLHTDHRALITVLKNEDPRGRIDRWNSALQAYDFQIRYVKGLDNGLTNALSRDFIDDNDMIGSQFMAITRSQGPPTRTIRRPRKLDILTDVLSDKTNDDFECENSEYTSEDNYNDEIELVEEIINDNDTTTNTTISNKFCMTEFLPSSTTFEKAQQSDAKCHRRTLDKIKTNFFWPKMSRDVFGYIQSCRICQLTKHSTLQAPGDLQPIIVLEPFKMVSIDHAGPFPTTEKGNRYILDITDLLTRWVDAVAVPDASTETTIKALEKRLIVPHGCPNELLSDNGSSFTSQQMQILRHKYGIKQIFISPYHPKTNGMTERFNRTLKAMIKAYCTEEQSKWDEHLDMYILAYRTAKHQVLGISPFEALYRRKPKLPANTLMPTNPNVPINIISYERKLEAKLQPIRTTIIKNNEVAKEAMRYRYNARHRAVTYETGDYVLLKRQTAEGSNSTLGLSTSYTGP
ncbi:Transposon Tf2-6 polyprotein [Smittium culicis]|uniref:Transposon Tf2-6 polyprotein n=1 Tax=Smittium culicis TaxID=133412 RepID=A0A1R1XAM6_9FUNG|nr:Transposon Tf2-6 polyprotein [Smittium culicis]